MRPFRCSRRTGVELAHQLAEQIRSMGATQREFLAVFGIFGFLESFDLGDSIETRRCRKPFALDARSVGTE
jgi:hypothetical protein